MIMALDIVSVTSNDPCLEQSDQPDHSTYPGHNCPLHVSNYEGNVLNAREITHQEPKFLCQFLNCKYHGSHTDFELREHIRRSHQHIAAVLVKGRAIPWNTPAPDNSKVLVLSASYTVAPPSVHSEHAFLAIDDPDVLEFDDNDILSTGFTDDIHEYVQHYNAYIQAMYKTARIHTPTSRSAISDFYIDNVRLCSGNGQIGCPFRARITMSTSCLVPQDRTAANGISKEKVLILRSRCLLCTRESNMSSMQSRLVKEVDGVLICSQTAKCTRPRLSLDAYNAKSVQMRGI
ncbi:hypothetical protein BP5796_07760 [Coleophoma crateriformis]|uniref:Uncharacterized protein n=1 Tax=Coleophoma crateriformis TaxID=565419 RepID=A0A3D8RCP7_9HELO|nr:hypothetical protein BP5796_07760 [Coleophoma crateriformis]